MGIHAIIFDLDGTLIDSNRLKYDAYFTLFPADDHHDQIIRTVLSEIFEQSRFVILEEILRRLDVREKGSLKQEVSKLAERYSEIVLAGAKTCPEKPGAEEALKRLAPAWGLYVSSTTPDAALKEILRFRKWTGYFRAVFGYPHEKSETLRRIITLEKLTSNQVLVVGDGESDRKSAQENKTPFLQVTEQFRFEGLEREIEALRTA
ncbi:MAG: HAD family hydrolase [Deltaproteobacteria bacterium]|nr:HAD family hydrolase [Deltaproteobacteria bacterium]